MNINEDKFANKSAEEIVNDMLTQHKNNSKEALEHMQDILKDDGLILSADTKATLKKAVDILSDKGLKEGWFSKPEAKYEVKFEVYLPFKKEPAEFQIPPVASLNDPLVKETLAKIRKRHPHSTIYIRSELGNQRITEEKKNSSWLKNVLSSDLVKNLAAVGLSAATGGAITPILTKPISNAALSAISDSTDYQINFHGKETYTCSVKSLPIALTLVEKAKGDYKSADILKDSIIVCSYDHSLKEWAVNDNLSILKEDIYTNDDTTIHSYADLKKDVTNIDERMRLILCHLNPNLIDKRKPKWHNTLTDIPKIVALPNENGEEIKAEVLITLDSIDNEINKSNPDQTEVLIKEKIPNGFTDTGFTYKDGESFVITVKQFKDIIESPENFEILTKFEKSKDSAILNDEQASYFLELDKTAKQNIDNKYPEWEATHWDLYNLDTYTLPERAEIYLAWKDANRTTAYQQARELTPEEVNLKFGLPKLKQILNNQVAGKKIMTAFDSVKRALPETEQAKLNTDLLNLLTNVETIDDSEIAKLIGYYGAKNQLNQLSNGKLATLENELLTSDLQDAFNDDLKQLIQNKYINSNGIPTVAQNYKNALEDIKTIVKKYQNHTDSSMWNQTTTSVKEVGELTKQILNNIKQMPAEISKQTKEELIQAKNKWQKNGVIGIKLINELNAFLVHTYEILNNKPNYKEHELWQDGMKSLYDPKSKAQDPSYYTAITNKISRLVKNDPTAAKGYGDLFRKLLKDLETKYPDPYSPEVENALIDFLNTMKDETKGYATTSKALASAL